MKKVDWNRKSVLNNPENFPYVLKILASALNLKTVIKETLKVIQANEQTIESFKTARRRKRPRDISQRHLSGCMSTLKKAKKAKNENACAEVNDERPYPESPCPGSPSSEPLI
ncbi:uncharacterized protein OCT59_026887 [Rhizophagus irregularis]|nr:hypothetical protein RirG_115220 [Rhizophagus irregularis DAOM 197198w]UZO06571.1 hypothetical protein OCT59_026887 [Rhizophagus irregularis]